MNQLPSEPSNTPPGKSKLGLISTIIGVSLFVLPIMGCILLAVIFNALGINSIREGESPAGWGMTFLVAVIFSSPIVGVLFLIASAVGLALGVYSLTRSSGSKGLPIAGSVLNFSVLIIIGCLVLTVLLGLVSNIQKKSR